MEHACAQVSRRRSWGDLILIQPTKGGVLSSALSPEQCTSKGLEEARTYWDHIRILSRPQIIHISPISRPVMHSDTIKTMMFWNRLKPSDQYNAKSRMKTSHTRKPTIEATISPIGPDFRISVGDTLSLSMVDIFGST
jgi:hypothetical protein